jgi:DNA-binding response OmpR family regulator
MKALVVDDEAEIRHALATGLRLAKCEQVDTAGSGEEAIALAMDSDYDLVTLDVRMPNVSGLDVLPTLRSLIPHSIIAVISAFVGGGISEVHKEHADLMIQKPFKLDHILTLSKLVQEISSRRGAIRELSEISTSRRGQDAKPRVEQVRMWYQTRSLKDVIGFYQVGLGFRSESEAADQEIVFAHKDKGAVLAFEERADAPENNVSHGRLTLMFSSLEQVASTQRSLEQLGYPASEFKGTGCEGVSVIDPDGRFVVLAVPLASR